MLYEQINNKKSLLGRRKQLRKNLTHAENRAVEERKLRRQHSVGYYILDFYCPPKDWRSSWMVRIILQKKAKEKMQYGRSI